MSLGEILVVIIVAIFVMKTEDIVIILKKLHQLKTYLLTTRNEILSYIGKDLQIDKPELNNLDELNFYLQKIISIKGSYEGDYSLHEIKKRYYELIKNEIDASNGTKDKNRDEF